MDAMEIFYEMEIRIWNFQINCKLTFLTLSVMGIVMNSNLPSQIKVLTQATINKQSHCYWGISRDRETTLSLVLVLWYDPKCLKAVKRN